MAAYAGVVDRRIIPSVSRVAGFTIAVEVVGRFRVTYIALLACSVNIYAPIVCSMTGGTLSIRVIAADGMAAGAVGAGRVVYSPGAPAARFMTLGAIVLKCGLMRSSFFCVTVFAGFRNVFQFCLSVTLTATCACVFAYEEIIGPMDFSGGG